MEQTGTRVHLPLERMRLTNQRTGLTLVAVGTMLLQFFSRNPLLLGLPWVLMLCATIPLAIGKLRFARVNKRRKINS